jgi:hypothetical protein
VKLDVQAQVQITQAFGQQASKAIGDLGTQKLKEAADLKEQASNEPDADKRAQLVARATQLEATWAENSSLRNGLHVITSALTGGLNAAAATALTSQVMPVVVEQMDKAGFSSEAKQAISQLVILGTFGQHASGAFNADTLNRALHEKETALIKAKSQAFADKINSLGVSAKPITAQQAQDILAEQAHNRIDQSANTVADVNGNDSIKAQARRYLNDIGKDAGSFTNETGEKTQFFTNRDEQGNLRQQDFVNPKLYADIKAYEEGKFTGTVAVGSYLTGLGGDVEMKFEEGKLVEFKGVLGAGWGAKAVVIPNNPLHGTAPGVKLDGDGFANTGSIKSGETRIGFTAGYAANAGPLQAGLSGSAGAGNSTPNVQLYGEIKPEISIVPAVGLGSEAKVGIEFVYRIRETPIINLPSNRATAGGK